jgi:hypothetical protein
MAPLDWLSFTGMCAEVVGVFFALAAVVWEESPGWHPRMMWVGSVLIVSGLALQLWIFFMKR